MQEIHVKQLMNGLLLREGAGVKLKRYIGADRRNDVEPILLFDYFDSDDPMDYMAGFPSHPHRGFETITYMLQGSMQHEDNHGRRGVINSGDVQWMTAGKGIIHSEMPAQQSGRLSGVQIWLNLPAAQKLCQPNYQEFVAAELPVETNEDGVRIKVIAGKTAKTASPLSNIATDPLFFDIRIPAHRQYHLSLPATHQSILFVLSGSVQLAQQTIGAQTLAILSEGDGLTLVANDGDTVCLLLAAKKLHEPIARLGPFVMTTQSEVQQALDDFRNNKF